MKALLRRSCPWAVALVFLAVPVGAQPGHGSSRAPSRVPVTVALVEHLPYPEAPFVILRQSIGRDYILLPAQADAALLTEAVNALLLARTRGGDSAAVDAVLRVRAPQRRAGARRPLPWAARVLADLRRAPRFNVPSVGEAPALQIWLPRQTGPRRTAPRATP